MVMKSLIRVKVLVVALLLLSIVFVSSCGLGTAYRVDKQYIVSNSANISIDMEVGDVSIGISPDNNVYITYYEYDTVKYDVIQNNNEIVLKQNIDKEWVTGSIKGMTMLIPAQFDGGFNTKIDVGDMAVKDIFAKNISVNTNVGDIEVQNISTENISLNCNVGDIELHTLNATLSTIIGSDVGDVEGTILGNQSDFTIIIDTNIGSSNIYSSGSGNKKLNVATNVGDIKIYFTE